MGEGKELYWELCPCVEEAGEGGKQTERERERETDRELGWEQCPHVEEDGEGGKQTQKERERERERERETCMVTCIGNNVSL